ncbi:C39 family peptidase [Photobacterium iliopiscarium]|uniref:Peptidase C39-like domain-containing protein n=1 Tax=Photobacterium iliopiscarium TaxID=56192 RepID=A0A2T3MPP4_9GAMM|nr:C39 family peptidase [Photobacterium iliopiscarium]PSV98768.1 hypothetical protein C9I88_04895 [Photobacterium iliopiscarium]
MNNYLISQFDKSTLTNLVKECFGSDFPDIFKKKQIDYIYNYLKDLGAKSVLLEPKYVDKDYLEDFNNFYVKCFNNKGAMTARLHFFSIELTHKELDEILIQGDKIDKIQISYLGFTVIKPLLKNFIGKTCLRAYPSIISSNHKKTIHRKYDVSLFGIPLTVNTIAFQEQDKVVSACATTSIWCALHGNKNKNIRDIISCSEITKNAINHISGSQNNFPNKELSNKQMLRSLDMENLKHHLIDTENYSKDRFFDLVKTYIDSDIPLILGATAYSIDDDKNLSELAGHAVTIIGYNNKNGKESLYIHDDRTGPYARSQIVETKNYKTTKNISKWGLILNKKDNNMNWVKEHEILLPLNVIIATNKKVRLTSEKPKKTCEIIIDSFESKLKLLGCDAITSFSENLKFNITLKEISEIKKHILKIKPTNDTENKSKLDFLTGSYARFQWVASFMFNEKEIFIITFDATDIIFGDAVSAIIINDSLISELVLKDHIENNSIEKYDNDSSFYFSFLNKLKQEKTTYESFLNETFGELRAPSYLKEEEIINGEIKQNENKKEYFCAEDQKLEDLYPDIKVEDNNSFLIWTITKDGTLIIGQEINSQGHPTLTGFKPSRIAGELKLKTGNWEINSKSGRYSSDYQNVNILLNNAVQKFVSIFPNSKIIARHFQPD